MYIKTPTICKCQRFNNSENEETAPRKHQWFDERNNEKRQDLNKNESKVKSDRYVPLPSPALSLFP